MLVGREIPQAEYQRRFDAWQMVADRCSRQDERLSLLRGLVFAGGLVLWIAIGGWSLCSPHWLWLPAGTFLVLVIIHGRVFRRQALAKRGIAHYRAGLDRLQDRWQGGRPNGERFRDPAHLYADDLDILGEGSLFQRLCSARTLVGEETLAAWLLQRADLDVVARRQQAVGRLQVMVDLRERLGLLDAEIRDGLDQRQLRTWAAEPASPLGKAVLILAALLALCTASSLVYCLVLDGPVTWFLICLLLHLVFWYALSRRVLQEKRSVGRADFGLRILSEVLEILEESPLDDGYFERFQADLKNDVSRPSREIRRLRRLFQGLSNALSNQFWAPIAFLLCLPVYYFHQIEQWRQRAAEKIPVWLDAVGEFEALVALAEYAYENPSDPFPELTEQGPCFEAEQIGHPLLPLKQTVFNDVALNSGQVLLVISGSNMSGKSTLLRSVGTNAVLAWAGGPVRAKSLKLSPHNLATAMRIHDSLLQGESLFYAVISRLGAVLKKSEQPPRLLFLLDEILQGTNSHDRRIGAAQIISQLLERGAIGLVTTHDLALTDIVQQWQDRAANFHFEDHLVDSRMTFDYVMRPGVVRKSNALELMRMVGIDIPDDEVPDSVD